MMAAPAEKKAWPPDAVIASTLWEIAFVFLLCSLLGGWDGKKPLVHGLLAVATVGGMWSLFTFGLGVLLPAGSLLEGF